MKLDTFFIFLLISLFMGSIPQLFIFKETIPQRQAASTTYPRIYELMYCLLIAVALTAIQLLVTPALKYLGKRIIIEDKLHPDLHNVKVARFAHFFSKSIYFICISSYAFLSLRIYNWFPEVLGGTGNIHLVWKEYPLQDNDGFLRWYYFISGGYQLFNMIFLLSEPPMPDFWQALLENCSSMILINFSYMANMLRIGSIIMFCHDFCDVFSLGCKTLVDTSMKPLTFSLFLCLMASWAYLRLYCFPVICLNSVLRESIELVPQEELLGIHWLSFLLLVQLLLNIYWFLLMFKMLWHFLSSGQTVDMHSPIVSEYKKTK